MSLLRNKFEGLFGKMSYVLRFGWVFCVENCEFWLLESFWVFWMKIKRFWVTFLCLELFERILMWFAIFFNILFVLNYNENWELLNESQYDLRDFFYIVFNLWWKWGAFFKMVWNNDNARFFHILFIIGSFFPKWFEIMLFEIFAMDILN